MNTYYPFYRSVYYTRIARIACPACRGYSLERQWCSFCEGKGYVKNKEQS